MKYLKTSFYSKYLLPSMGFLLLLYFIWFRFLRERLPREIPVNLSISGFIILFTICLLYAYNIYKIFKPSSLISGTWNILLHRSISLVILPLINFNQVLLSIKTVRNIMKRVTLFCSQLFSDDIKNQNSTMIYTKLFILPKMMFLVLIIIDCFYIKHLQCIYTGVFVMSFPLLIQYILNVSETSQKYDTELLDANIIIEIISEDIIYSQDNYDDEGFLKDNIPIYAFDPSELNYYRFYEDFDDITPYIDLPKYNYLKTTSFIEYQVIAIYNNNILYQYKILFHKERLDTKSILISSNLTKIECEKILQYHIKLCILKKYIDSVKNYYRSEYRGNIIQYIEIIVNILILNCWMYILVKSLYTLPENIF